MTRMRVIFLLVVVSLAGFALNISYSIQPQKTKQTIPIYIAFLWHYHQPLYDPDKTATQSMASDGRIREIFDSRVGPYTTWPRDAIQCAVDAGLQDAGASISFSGSLVENLNDIEANGECYGHFSNWKSAWYSMRHQQTSHGNPRFDFVGFAHFHPLNPLVGPLDLKEQIKRHKEIIQTNFGSDVSFSKGYFPAEDAFAEWMIPVLVEEGFEWVVVDSLHLFRATQGYPFSEASDLSWIPPDPSDMRNPDPHDWMRLDGLWCGSKISPKIGYIPHYIEYKYPNGTSVRMIAVISDRYIGNEDGRGGFGALNYQHVLSQLIPYNNDPNHPFLVVMAHDGDNHGGGSDAYYHNNFQNFVNWVKNSNGQFVFTTIQDYLDQFPPDPNDVVHIEDGAWVGADSGDPQFRKWNGVPDASGYSPDRNSWAVVTATKNWVHTALFQNPSSSDTNTALRYHLISETSCYWYWDGQADWDSKPTKAANIAKDYADNVVNPTTETTPPSLFYPQREPWKPVTSVKIWTLVYDLSGLAAVELRYSIDGGSMQVASMSEETLPPSQTNPAPSVRASMYSVNISLNFSQHIMEYWIYARDTKGNSVETVHLFVGTGNISHFEENWINFAIEESQIQWDSPIDIFATITTSNGSITDAILFYRQAPHAWQNITMTKIGEKWKGVIPRELVSPGATIEYYVFSRRNDGYTGTSQSRYIHIPQLYSFTFSYNAPKSGIPLDVNVTVSSWSNRQIKWAKLFCFASGSVIQLHTTTQGYVCRGRIPESCMQRGQPIIIWVIGMDEFDYLFSSPTKVIIPDCGYGSYRIDGTRESSYLEMYTGPGNDEQNITGIWVGHDDMYFYLYITLGAPPDSDSDQDYVGIYISDGSSPTTNRTRYDLSYTNVSAHLEVAWWEKNPYGGKVTRYCEHIWNGSLWKWIADYDASNIHAPINSPILELKIMRVGEQTHNDWKENTSIEMIIATAYDIDPGYPGDRKFLTYTFTTPPIYNISTLYSIKESKLYVSARCTETLQLIDNILAHEHKLIILSKDGSLLKVYELVWENNTWYLDMSVLQDGEYIAIVLFKTPTAVGINTFLITITGNPSESLPLGDNAIFVLVLIIGIAAASVGIFLWRKRYKDAKNLAKSNEMEQKN
ncbi:MAG: hypothetical protein QXL15_01730 [Candidatus Korarchaeota archaeon]